MAKVLVSDLYLADIADAIRDKNKDTLATYTPAQMSQAITNIPLIVPTVMRPDTELIQTYTYDLLLIEDEQMDSTIEEFPAYATSAKTLRSSVNLTPTITVDLDDYNYYIVERLLTIPIYSVTTKAKGRLEFTITSALYELVEVLPNTIISLLGSQPITSRSNALSVSNATRELYWSSGTALAVYTATTYAAAQIPTAPVISGTTLTIKSPAFLIRGNTTYLTSTYFNAITDIRLLYVIEVYRAPKNNLTCDGWGNTHEIAKILNCINNNNLKLL